MKVIRMVEMETDRFEVGDQIKEDIDGAIYTATCQRLWTDEQGDACADFLLDDCVGDANHKDAVKWCEEHDMRLASLADLEAWELMADYRNRASGARADSWTRWWWLTDANGRDCFALVDDNGSVGSVGASFSLGIRPAFTI